METKKQSHSYNIYGKFDDVGSQCVVKYDTHKLQLSILSWHTREAFRSRRQTLVVGCIAACMRLLGCHENVSKWLNDKMQLNERSFTLQ